ncbi:MAG: polysaccharide biosynthesis/export family protein [Salibacteraceae bacterium]
MLLSNHRYLPLTLGFILLCLLASCGTQRLYQSEKHDPINDSLLQAWSDTTMAYRLATDDKVSFSIWGHDDLSIGSVFGIYNSNEVYGKWVMVDPNGQITLPKIGRIAVAGMTCREAEDTLKTIYGRFIVDPIISVKVLNREVTVLGEVRDPGTFLLEKEHHHLLEVLGKAGGFNDYADLSSVRLVRLRGDQTVELELDLRASDQLRQLPLWMKNGDVIYIPPRRGKMFDKKAPTLIPFTSAITAVAIILSLIN